MAVHDWELYRQILGIEAPWTVSDIEVDLKGGGVTVHIEYRVFGDNYLEH